MVDDNGDRITSASRLDRLPTAGFHVKFMLMIASGEFVEGFMLLGNGALLALVAAYFAFGKGSLLAVYAIPVPFFLGEFVGALVLGRFADRVGRRTIFLWNQLLFGIAMILAGFMNEWYLIALLVGIGGVGVGAEYPIVDTLSSEFMPAKKRGQWLSLVNVVTAVAAPLIVYIASLTSGLGFYAFRIPFWIAGVAGILVWLVRLGLPESPRWLEMQGRNQEADKVMDKIEAEVMRQKHITKLPEVTDNTKVVPRKSSFKEIFAPDVRKRTIMMLIFQFFQAGIFYGFVSFAPSLVSNVTSNIHGALGFASVIYSGFVVGGIVGYFILDHIERKWTLIGFAMLAGVFGVIMSQMTSTFAVVALGFLVAVSLWIFQLTFHQYQAEIFPTRIRSTAAGATYSLSRVATSIVTLIIARFFLPHGTLAVFGFIWVLIAVVVVDIAVLGPKTTKQSLESIAS